MNRRNILSMYAIAALGLTLLSGNALAQQKALKEQLVGIWTLTSWEQTNKDGSKLQRYGSNPKGYNIFDDELCRWLFGWGGIQPLPRSSGPSNEIRPSRGFTRNDRITRGTEDR